MPSAMSLPLLILPLLLICLVVPAAIALYKIQALALPISSFTGVAALLLPLVSGAVLRSMQTISQRGYRISDVQNKKSFWIVASSFSLLVIYETIIATLALSHMVPIDNLSCQLDRQWLHLFSNKSSDIIRRIQDRHQCCGLNSVQDRAWPFPDRRNTAAACHEMLGRDRSCLLGWRQDEQIAAGLILLVAIATLLFKILMVTIYQRNHRLPFLMLDEPHYAVIDSNAQGDSLQRRIAADIYRDDPSAQQGTDSALAVYHDSSAAPEAGSTT